ncbi:MAG: hypothetical protein WB967_14330 [Mycobacterium sp.]|uniref:hypothetical protein n=1 Tax=Mycobacterium sp. TaxID=1785 RepID=UPI003C56C2AA
MLPPYSHDGLSIAICSAIASGPPIPPAFSAHRRTSFEYEASDDYLQDRGAHNILGVFDVAEVIRTAPRGWWSFDIRSPLLIYVSKGEPVFARITSEHRNFAVVKRPVTAR